MTAEPAADRLLAAATKLAAAEGHAFVGTEHLLAALLEDRAGYAATVLGGAGLEADQVAKAVLQGLQKIAEPTATPPPVSRFAERALDGARRLGDGEVTEAALLKTLLRQPRGKVAQVLRGDGKALPAMQAALGVEAPASRERPPREASAAPESPRAEPAGRKQKKERERPPKEPGARKKADRAEPRPAAEERSQKDKPTPAGGPPERLSRGEPERRDDRPLRIARPEPPRPFPWFRLLLAAVPVSVYLAWSGAPAAWTFAAACVGVLPLAGLMGEATESLAERTGPTVGGLLNATFGNAAELIIALAALRAGLVDLVKASITGSILGNLLLILGLSFVAGGLKSPVVRFNRTNAGMSAAMLALAVIGLVFPALFHAVHGPPDLGAELRLSEAVAVILLVTYGLSLLFSLKTHRALFGGGDHPDVEPRWNVPWSIAVLALATAGVVVESEILVKTIEGVTASLGISETFLGLVIVPLIGNAAEHATAVVVARKGQTDLALQIALGSSTQVALLIAPVLVFAGLVLQAPMNLVFPAFDVIALAVSTVVIAIITLDGETHWFEGVQLLAVYAMMAAAAFFI